MGFNSFFQISDITMSVRIAFSKSIGQRKQSALHLMNLHLDEEPSYSTTSPSAFIEAKQAKVWRFHFANGEQLRMSRVWNLKYDNSYRTLSIPLRIIPFMPSRPYSNRPLHFNDVKFYQSNTGCKVFFTKEISSC